MPDAAPLLEVRGLSKSFAAPVLRGLDLEIASGEVHALVGGNGAGKSTLARILAGLLSSDAGEIRLDGHLLQVASRRAAQAAGVTLMPQELNVLPTLTVAENIFLGRLPQRFGFVATRRLHEDARIALSRVGAEHLAPDTLAGRLGIGHQQQVEMAAALSGPCRLLILDEPTAALTAAEIEHLFINIRRLRGEGTSVLYISHRMDELRAIADRVSVLRDGAHVATLPAADASPEELVRLMAGHVTAARASRTGAQSGPVALKVSRLRAGVARDVSFEVRRGEILGLAGLVGAGRTETMRAIFGADPREGGTVEIDGKPVAIRNPREAVAAGLALVPEDRKAQGLLLTESIRTNTTLATLPSHSRVGLLSRRREAGSAREIIERLAVHCDSPEQSVARLSGGNQQKIVLGRWILRDADILLLDEPTRGVDAPSRDAIYALLRELAAQGKACVVASSEMEELMALCDRIAVISVGRSAGEFDPAECTVASLTAAAFSGHLAAA